jgi:hypothetical protein
MLLTYFLNDYEMVPVAPIITGITFVFTFHIIIIIIIIIIWDSSVGKLTGSRSSVPGGGKGVDGSSDVHI